MSTGLKRQHKPYTTGKVDLFLHFVHASTYDGEESVNRVLAEKLEGKRPFRRPRRRWEDDMVLGEVGKGEWTGLIWLRIGSDAGHL